MKIFISWSGQESKQVALLLKEWLKKVLQASDPWMSAADIVPGTRWAQTIATQLQNSDFGIICITPENRSAEWINFEAGALSIAIGETERKVVPLLIGFEDRNAVSTGPLGVFNALLFNKEDIWELVLTLNNELNVSVDAQNLAELFEFFWPKLDEQIQALQAQRTAPAPAPLDPNDMIKEILGLVRSMHADLGNYPSAPRAPHLATTAALASLLQDTSTNDTFNAWTKTLLLHSLADPSGKYRVSPSGFTRRELTVARMAKEGHPNREIAKQLNISERTVEGHLYKVLTKLGITKRSDIPDDIFEQDIADDEDDVQ